MNQWGLRLSSRTFIYLRVMRCVCVCEYICQARDHCLRRHLNICKHFTELSLLCDQLVFYPKSKFTYKEKTVILRKMYFDEFT